MKKILTILSITLLSITVASAQTHDAKGTEAIQIGQGDNTISNNDGKLRLCLNGMAFDFGKSENGSTSLSITPNVQKKKAAYFGFLGSGAASFNHLAGVELGVSTFVNHDYSAYTPEEANAMMFSNKKAVHFTTNLFTLNVPLNKKRTLVFSSALGFTCDNYTFIGNHTLEYRDGMMRPVAIEGSIKKSKLAASYFHMPIVLDWNIKHSFFISAGINFDVLMASQLKYKFPKTKVDDTVTLNPIQVGVTARFGWKRIYAFANYSLLDMFKQGTGPKGKRLSAGVGFWF